MTNAAASPLRELVELIATRALKRGTFRLA